MAFSLSACLPATPPSKYHPLQETPLCLSSLSEWSHLCIAMPFCLGPCQWKDPALCSYLFIVCLLTRPWVLWGQGLSLQCLFAITLKWKGQYVILQAKQGHLGVVRNLRCHHVRFSAWNSTVPLHVQKVMDTFCPWLVCRWSWPLALTGAKRLPVESRNIPPSLLEEL